MFYIQSTLEGSLLGRLQEVGEEEGDEEQDVLDGGSNCGIDFAVIDVRSKGWIPEN